MASKIQKAKYDQYVINPIDSQDLMGFLDDKAKSILKYFIVKSLFAQPETKIGQPQLPIQVPKEHIEQWFVQALDVKPVGAGSYPIDIYNDREHWGADIKMLNIKLDESGDIKNSDSGEASLGQKFEGPGVNLDNLFAKGKFEEIKDGWLKLFEDKYLSLNGKHSTNEIFFFFILRPGAQQGGADFYFCGGILNLNKLKTVQVSKRSTAKSVFLDNFIDARFGNTKVYKAKKRLELRLKPKSWLENGKLIKIKTSFTSDPINLRDGKIDANYLKSSIDKINQIDLDFSI